MSSILDQLKEAQEVMDNYGIPQDRYAVFPAKTVAEMEETGLLKTKNGKRYYGFTRIYTAEEYHYCPNCGTRMVEIC